MTTPLRFEPNIRYVAVERPPQKSDAPSVLAFSLAKAGSTLLYDILRMLAPHAGLTYFSVADDLFQRNISHNDAPSDIGNVFAPQGYCFGGFRQFPIYPVPILHSARAIFLVRDPRDMIVSLHFSWLKSHTIPGPAEAGSASERLLDARAFAERTPMQQFVVEALRPQLRLFEGYLAQGVHWRPNFAVYRYEDVIFSKRAWIEDICAWYGWSVPAAAIDEIVARVDVVPAEERPGQHIRQVVPGNYRKYFDEETLRLVNGALAQSMKIFGYS